MERSDSKEVRVDLLDIEDRIERHLTTGLCAKVFRGERKRERERKWTLYRMACFWDEVILHGPEALTQALQECQRGAPGWPHVEATEEAFFQKSAGRHPRFFAGWYEGFVESILSEAEAVFSRELSGRYDR